MVIARASAAVVAFAASTAVVGLILLAFQANGNDMLFQVQPPNHLTQPKLAISSSEWGSANVPHEIALSKKAYTKALNGVKSATAEVDKLITSLKAQAATHEAMWDKSHKLQTQLRDMNQLPNQYPLDKFKEGVNKVAKDATQLLEQGRTAKFAAIVKDGDVYTALQHAGHKYDDAISELKQRKNHVERLAPLAYDAVAKVQRPLNINLRTARDEYNVAVSKAKTLVRHSKEVDQVERVMEHLLITAAKLKQVREHHYKAWGM